MGFVGKFLFVDNLVEGRLMVAGNKVFMPVDAATNIPRVGVTITRLSLFRSYVHVLRDYFAFWKKENSNPDIKGFANILHDIFANSLKIN